MSEPCCREGHPLTAADLLKWKQLAARLAKAEAIMTVASNTDRCTLATRLAKAEALLREARYSLRFPMERASWKGPAGDLVATINAFLTPADRE